MFLKKPDPHDEAIMILKDQMSAPPPQVDQIYNLFTDKLTALKSYELKCCIVLSVSFSIIIAVNS